MARPRKCRMICALPKNVCFGPLPEPEDCGCSAEEAAAPGKTEAEAAATGENTKTQPSAADEKTGAASEADGRKTEAAAAAYEELSGSQPEDTLIMALDEYETIRLIDLLSCTQEECAEQMGVARTTVQAVYNSARQKLASSLVEGKKLLIRGGDYTLCAHSGNCCRQHCGSRNGCSTRCGNAQKSCECNREAKK